MNGPEILDKFIGEAERRVRELFIPAEREYDEVGDASALHIIILDEMDAIARKRGSMTSDTTGVVSTIHRINLFSNSFRTDQFKHSFSFLIDWLAAERFGGESVAS